MTKTPTPTIGSLFAGIGGFDLGFERAGWRTEWQVEINDTARAVLADNFPQARQFEDVTKVTGEVLGYVDCITAGFPCQDISQMGSRRKGGKLGLRGKRSGLFFEVIRLLREIRPRWVVLENVHGLLHSNHCEDIQVVIQSLADCGYVGCFRVLDARYFGVPQARRRVFLVAGLGQHPPMELLADAAPVEGLHISLGPLEESRNQMAWAGNTLTASNAASRISLGSEVLVCERGRRNKMAERKRISARDGIPFGMDVANLVMRHAAGNAVVPQLAQWIARILYPVACAPCTAGVPPAPALWQ